MLHYDKDAKLVKVFGVTGSGKGQIRQPHGQWVDDRVKDKPILLICDRGNSRLSRFGLDGTPLDSTESNTVVLQPCHAKTRGEVLIVPDLSARVSLLDKNNQPIVHLGDDEGWRKKVLTEDIRSKPKEWVAGKFVRPHEARFDKDGNILVTEWVTTGRVSFLKKVL
jgi:hypothetical protein